jgi:carbamoyltransferase
MSKTILGVNSAYHESAACLIHDGQIVAAVEEERFSRVKHAKPARVDNAHELPWQAIDACLKMAGLGYEHVDHIGYSLDPEARLKLNLDLCDSKSAVDGDFGSASGEEAFYRSNLEAGRLLSERMPSADLHYLEHHVCHAASAFTVSPLAGPAVIIAVDGIGELASTWIGIGIDDRIEPLHRIAYPHSLGFLWEKFSELLGFDRYGGPGKVMGYGCLTDPIGELSGRDYMLPMREIVQLRPGADFFVDNEVMCFRSGDFGPLEARFGPRRPAPVDRYEDASIAAALQVMTEEVLLHVVQGAYELASAHLAARGQSLGEAPALCLAGGVALNCVANDLILRKTPFGKLWIQPAANDAGTALGAAAYLYADRLGLGPRPKMPHAFWGPEYDTRDIEVALDRAGIAREAPSDITRAVAKRIANGEIVAWYQGRLEFGPRALGHRSILADPTRFDTRNRINTQVKLRESFRPFAPSVMAEEVSRFFDLPKGALPADVMLLAPPLRDEKLAQVIPAVVQENGSLHRSTSRLHRVDETCDPLYHGVLRALHEHTGVGAVLNTSFNIREPIVNTPEQALATFRRSKMSALAIGPYLVKNDG